MSTLPRPLAVVLLAAVAASLTSCASRGLLTERYPTDVYTGVEALAPGVYDRNPRFVAFGDTQSGWRVQEKFVRKERWVTKKGLIFPFFYLYNIGQGVVGTVNYFRQVPDYGGVERRLVRDAVYDEVVQSRPDFLLHLGDICLNDGRRPRHWATYLEESKVDVPLLTSVPVVAVIGNHEHANDEEYGLPNFRAVFPETPRFYVVDFPDLALFVVDSNFILDQYRDIDTAQQEALWREWIVAGPGQPSAWLERELAGSTRRFKVVAMHHPPVSIGYHTEDWTRADWGDDLRGKRREFLNLLIDSGVQLVLSGHEHIYQHTTVRRLADGDLGDHRLHVVVTSGGGAPARPLQGREVVERRCEEFLEDGLVVDLVKMERAHHYSVVDASAGALTIETYRIGAEGGKGPVIDSVVINGE